MDDVIMDDVIIDDNIMDDDIIDDAWVTEYKREEERYNDFYNEKVNNIKVFFMYINTDKTIVNIRQESLSLNNDSILTKEQLIKIIKDKQKLNNVKYKLFSIVRYNIDLEPGEINDFISDNISVSDTISNTISNTITKNDNYNNRFFIDEKNINDIYFTKTITIFQDLNALYIIFKECEKNKCLYTKKIKNYIRKNRHTRHKKHI
jgi:hypothetical protein